MPMPHQPPDADTPSALGDSPSAVAEHPAASRWRVVVQQLQQTLAERGIAPRRAVVLVPYAQLMDIGRRAWALAYPDGFPPRFETSRNWAAGLQPFVANPGDLTLDMAPDSLTAAALLDQVGSARPEGALRAVMVSRLIEAARQLAPLAAAVPPAQRAAWAQTRQEALAPGQTAALRWEALVASVALLWVGMSNFPTDVLWGEQAQPGQVADALLVLQGFQEDPLGAALAAHWGDRAAVLHWPVELGDCLHGPADAATPSRSLGLHACGDAEDEAQRAAACVLAHVNAARWPVALVANDRLLTRRVSAMLQSAGLGVRDETGWKLSTTHVAAQFMSLLRAADARASMDDVLDLLKQTSQWSDAQVGALEQRARETQVTRWQAALRSPRLAGVLPTGLADSLSSLQKPRPLLTWLSDVGLALQAVGLWSSLSTDAAGQQLLAALHLNEGAAQTLDAAARVLDNPTAPSPAARMTLAAFTAWVRDVLESASFVPPRQTAASVVVLPMAQLLGRTFAATVVPGCDENHLNPSPEPTGDWTVAQRQALGLPPREALAQSARLAWLTALQQPALDVLWRTQARGETLLPSAWVQALWAAGAGAAADPREPRRLSMQPQHPPAPTAADLLPDTLSASAYQDLRNCPYRFFALRQLRLVDAPELQDEPDQRDLGNWLHAVLRAFHEQRGDLRPGREADRAALDRHARDVAERMGLTAHDGAGFLPFQAVWPALREGYLDWLGGFEAQPGRTGPRFWQAEAALTTQASGCTLYGKLDRVDRQDSPEGEIALVMDYKTESRSTTLNRVKEPLEDTQLAFYAALLPHDNLRAAYLSITDQRGQGPKDSPTVLIEQEQVLLAREHLLAGLAHDLSRIRDGHGLRALGEGSVCTFCAARGLCRKDFWSAPA
ncbi:MAG: hypothetical protein RLZZ352_926 [Pseudomonadota bacterium]